MGLELCLQPGWAERVWFLVSQLAASAFVTMKYFHLQYSAIKIRRLKCFVSPQYEQGENSLTKQESPFAFISACNPSDYRQTLTFSAPIRSSSIQISVTTLLPPDTHFGYFHPINQTTSHLQPVDFCQALPNYVNYLFCEDDL